VGFQCGNGEERREMMENCVKRGDGSTWEWGGEERNDGKLCKGGDSSTWEWGGEERNDGKLCKNGEGRREGGISTWECGEEERNDRKLCKKGGRFNVGMERRGEK
jgi:hypothetical protein